MVKYLQNTDATTRKMSKESKKSHIMQVCGVVLVIAMIYYVAIEVAWSATITAPNIPTSAIPHTEQITLYTNEYQGDRIIPLASATSAATTTTKKIIAETRNSESILWDILIHAKLYKESLLQYTAEPASAAPNTIENSKMAHKYTVIGNAVDHNYSPIQNATITIRVGTQVVSTTTNQTGYFEQELGEFTESAAAAASGSYILNINAHTEHKKVGWAKMQFYIVGGENTKKSDELWKRINTPAAQKYIQAEQKDFEGNLVGMRLYQYYQKIYAEYNQTIQRESKYEKYQQTLELQRQTSQEYLQQSIQEENPGIGTYQGYLYERFINSIKDDSVRDIMINQINYTKKIFFEAQQIRKQILEDGGTAQEAMQAYHEKLASIQQKMQESHMTGNSTTSLTKKTK